MVQPAVEKPQATPKPTPHPQAQARRRIAFVCIGNSCRSQMAEAWVRHLSPGGPRGVEFEAVSAGLHPLGYITDETYSVMGEKNVGLEGQYSKGREEIDWQQVDVLVNMTGLSGRSVVPSFPGAVEQWEIPDPFGQPLETYRKVRNRLERRVKRLLKQLEKSAAGGPAALPPA